MQNDPSRGLNDNTTITENTRTRKLLFAGVVLGVLIFFLALPYVSSFICRRSAENWAAGWNAWKCGDSAEALACWSRDRWLSRFAPRPARLCYWRARALEDLGLNSEAERMRLKMARQYPFDFYTFLFYVDGGASISGWMALIKTARIFSPRPWSDEVAKASHKTGVSDKLIWALMKRESKFKANAVSKNGAVGLMQLMPQTAEEDARRLHIVKPDIRHPQINILLGAKHFADLMRRYPGELPRAVAAYNAGAAPVSRWGTLNAQDWAEWVEEIPYLETREFVRSVLENAETYRIAYGNSGVRPLALTVREHPSPIPVRANSRYFLSE